MPRSNQHFFPKTLVNEEVYTCEYNQGWLHYDALHPQERGNIASKVLEILGLDIVLVWEYPSTKSWLHHSLVAMVIL